MARAAAAGTSARPDAMCVSTVDQAGSPHARFVDLKGVRADGFVFCTSHLSPKGRQIDGNPNVALTFWWDHVGRQVRVLGRAERISAADADELFAARSTDAQLASWAFEQSAIVSADESPAQRMEATRARLGSGAVRRPPHWGGYLVRPRQLEFLQFAASRMHHRVLYAASGGVWRRSELQP